MGQKRRELNTQRTKGLPQIRSQIASQVVASFLAAAAAIGVPTNQISATLPSMTGASAGVVTRTAALTASIPSLTGAGAGEHNQAATVAGTLPSLIASANALIGSQNLIAATLPSLTAAIVSDHNQAATVAASLPSLTASLAAGILVEVTAAATLPSLTASGTALQGEGFVDWAQSSTGTVSLPSSAQAGDIAVIAEYAIKPIASFGTLELVPSGWALFDDGSDTTTVYTDSSGNRYQYQLYWKELTAGDISGGSVTSQYSTHNTIYQTIQVFRAAAAIDHTVVRKATAEYGTGTAPQTLTGVGRSMAAIHIVQFAPYTQKDLDVTPDQEDIGLGATKFSSQYFPTSGTNWTIDDDATVGPNALLTARLEIWTEAKTAAATAAIPALTGTVAATSFYTAAASASLPSLTAAVVADHNQAATVAATIPSLTAAIVADHNQAATVAATLPSLTAAIVVPSNLVGAVTATLPSLTAAVVADHNQAATVAASLPSLTASVVADHNQAATTAATLPSLTASAAASGSTGVTVGLPATTQTVNVNNSNQFLTYAGYRFNPDGTVDIRNGNSTWTYDHDWCDPTGGTPGNDYDIYVVHSGTWDANVSTAPSGDSLSSYLLLDTAREYYLRDTTSGGIGTGISCTLTVYIIPKDEDDFNNADDSQTYQLASRRT